MKRTPEQILEYESRLAFRDKCPKEWIIRDKNPDVGIDMEIEFVKEGYVENKVLWVQMKAKKSIDKEDVTLQIETKHLKYYEGCQLPVVVVLWIKSKKEFYFLFAQKYLEDVLTSNNETWENQKTNTLYFPQESKLDDIKELDAIARDGYLYIAQQRMGLKQNSGTAQYWLDGIPQSDDDELKERTLKALLLIKSNKFRDAINEFENILMTCTLSPTKRMSVLINTGNAYYSISKIDEALKNYKAILNITTKVSEREALEGESIALGNIGLIYSDKGELDAALKYLQDALEIHKEIGYKQGEANQLGNIGLIYSDKGELDAALKYHKDALKIDQEIGYKQGEASDLGNIGLIYSDKGELDAALKYLQDALEVLNNYNLFYGRDIIQRTISSILNK